MKKRPLLDLVLLVLLLTELASFFVSSRVHEVLGVAFVVLVLVHLWWNAGFFVPSGAGGIRGGACSARPSSSRSSSTWSC